jgi:transcriptional regulator NrdR family protein
VPTVAPTTTNKIPCQSCGHGCSRVTDSRVTQIELLSGKRSKALRRRRECLKCKERFTTLETYYREVVQ